MSTKKNKVQKNLLTAGISLATMVAIGVVSDTQAQASDTNNNDNASVDLDALNKDVNVQEGVVKAKEEEVTKGKNKVEEVTSKVKKLEEKSKEATEENINKLEKDVESNKTTLKNEKEKVSTLSVEKANKEKDVSTADSDVSTAKSELTKATEETKNAQSNLQKAKDTLAGINEEKVIKDLDKAKKEVEADKIDLAKKEKTLEEAKKSDKDREDKINLLTSDKEKSSKELEKATTNLEEKTKEVNVAREKLRKSVSNLEVAKNNAEGINRIILSDEYVKALKDSFDYDNLTREDREKAYNKLSELSKKDIKLNNYKQNKNDDDKTLYDIENLPENIRTELSLFAADLINQIREKFNLPKVEVTSSAIEFAKKVGDGYTRDNWNADEKGHDAKVINEVARGYGLSTTALEDESEGMQYYENYYGYSINRKNVTVALMKESIYKGIIAFMLNEYEWLHAQSIAGINYGSPDEEYFGLDFSISNGYTNVHYIKVGKKDVKASTLKNFNTTEIKNNNSTVDILEKLKTAEESYNIVNTDFNTKDKDRATLETSYNNIKEVFEKVSKDLENAEGLKVLTPEATKLLNDAQNKLTKDNEALDKAQNDYNSLTADIKEKQRMVEEASKVVEEKIKIQEEKQTIFSNKEKVLNSLLNELIGIKEQLSNKEKDVLRLENDIKAKEDRLVELKNTPKLLNDSQVELESLKLELTVKEKELKEEITKYEKLYSKKLRHEVADLKNDLPEALIKETTREDVVKYNIKEEKDTTIEQGRRVVKVKGVNGKRKVKVATLVVNGEVINSFEEVISEEEPVDEIVLVGTKVKETPEESSKKDIKKQEKQEIVNKKEDVVREVKTMTVSNKGELPKLSSIEEETSSVLFNILGVVLTILTFGIYKRKAN